MSLGPRAKARLRHDSSDFDCRGLSNRTLHIATYRADPRTHPLANAADPANEWNELLSLIEPHVLALDEQFAEHGGPTFFEITTAMALLAFARQQANAVVLEVGMGGRLDSTNVVQPVVSVITSIGFDHHKQLGRTLSTIAREKAGSSNRADH